MSDQKFQGFVLPKTNFFHMPNEWTDITHDMTSMSEIKVVEYVLRHTWGYKGEEDEPKRISIDEFANGRKKKGGERMDKGTGLSPESVRTGLKKAVEHGFLRVDEDRKDMARIKRYFSLVFAENPPPEFRARSLDVRGLDLGSRDRTKKETFRKTTKEREGGDTSPPPPHQKPRTKKRRTSKGRKRRTDLTDFDRRAAAHLRVVVVENEIPRLSIARIDTLAEPIRKLRIEGKIPKERIKAAIIWLRCHYGEQFCPSLFKAKDVFDKFAQIECQMKNGDDGAKLSNGRRITFDNMYDTENCENGVPRVWIGSGGKRYDGLLLEKVRRTCQRKGLKGLPSKDEVNDVLESLGEKQGMFPPDVVGRLW